MKISEAAKKAIVEGKYIARKGSPFLEMVKIKPTNTPDCCVLYSEGKAPCRGWEPQAEDLTSDCWDVVD